MQYPDPHFKKKHYKRRGLQKPLVGAIVDNLSPGGQKNAIEKNHNEVGIM